MEDKCIKKAKAGVSHTTNFRQASFHVRSMRGVNFRIYKLS